jgi:hypothetical protein
MPARRRARRGAPDRGCRPRSRPPARRRRPARDRARRAAHHKSACRSRRTAARSTPARRDRRRAGRRRRGCARRRDRDRGAGEQLLTGRQGWRQPRRRREQLDVQRRGGGAICEVGHLGGRKPDWPDGRRSSGAWAGEAHGWLCKTQISQPSEKRGVHPRSDRRRWLGW